MTDGGAQYPKHAISKFQKLMAEFPKRFKYSGIEFNCDNDVMKNIETALQGKTLQASNFKQLVQAYQQCIEIIAYKEK